MPKAPKTGKGRLDKYYHLAKEQGYRARSAFKLVQINKKYNILAKAKVLIDLCAAPGGWLQVAAKCMPAKSLIIGVDLVPIKPIPNVITHKEDITTDKCRAVLRQDLKTWKADVVLHDGAPNVGAAWVHDAYSQSELVLSSLKLAVEFLDKGGCFVTKVFRSKDYNNLMWVFNQLFGKVEATKPASSRNVSAEIFVVCRDFTAPKRIDPKFLDPKHVFQDLEPTASVMKPVDVFHPEKTTRHRDGYDDGDYILYKTRPVVEFVKSPEPTTFLGTVNALAFDDTPDSQLLGAMPETTAEVRECVKDLKVLGKKDFKLLLRWRVAAREALNPKKPVDAGADVKHEKEEEEAVDLDEELERLSKEEQTRQKRAKRKANERRAKELVRMQLNMTIPTEIGVEQSPAGGTLDDISNENLFDIDRARRKRGTNFADEEDMDDERAMLEKAVGDAAGAPADDEDNESSAAESDADRLDELDAELDACYADYKERLSNRDAKYRARQSRAEDAEEWHGFSGGAGQNAGGDGSSSDEESGDDDMASERHAPDENSDSEGDASDAPAAATVRRKGETPGKLSRDAAVFFDNPLFKEVEESEDAEPGKTPVAGKDVSSEKEVSKTPKRASTKRKIEEVDGAGDREEAEDDEAEESEDGIEVVARERDDDAWNGDSDDDVWNGDSDDESSKKKKPDYTLMAAEAMTLAQQLVTRQKTKADLVDEGFNRYAFNDAESLPEWFLDDERKHNRRQMPITKEAAEAIKARLRALDARPIKKIAEAKARKKQKAVQQYNKMVKKTEALVENPEMSEKSKAQNVAKILAKGKRKPKKEVKLVVAKGANRGNKGRPKGVKGRYKMVDSRMKKEVRAEKRKQTKGKKKQQRR